MVSTNFLRTKGLFLEVEGSNQHIKREPYNEDRLFEEGVKGGTKV